MQCCKLESFNKLLLIDHLQLCIHTVAIFYSLVVSRGSKHEMGKHRQSSRVQMATTMPSYLMIIRMQFSSSKVQFSSYVADKIRLCNRNAYTHDVANIFRCLSYSTVTTVIELSTYRSSPAFNAAVTAVPEASPTQLFYDIDVLCTRDDQYPVCRLDIQQDSEFATGYGYPKSALKREPDTDLDIQNAFIDISRIYTFGKSCTLHNH